METSVTIIGIVIAIIVAIPIYFSARSSAENKAKILNIKKKFDSVNPENFSLTESQSNKTLTIDQNNKRFILMNFNPNQQESTYVDLKNISSCRLVLTTDGNSDTILKIDFEFQEKDNAKKSIYLSMILMTTESNRLVLIKIMSLQRNGLKSSKILFHVSYLIQRRGSNFESLFLCCNMIFIILIFKWSL
ncbi:hypothetical protein ACQ9BO_12075 [Flavobacterium sp. P21]|uniref:hypothetical protein n=1 Tax=Flavobacterium sp. P21 TaxID=3423948 RepID=UPI003D679F91